MRAWLGLVALCLGMVMLFMNTTMINVALPELATSMGAGTRGLEWIVSSYNLAFLAVLLPGGALGDRSGHRRALVGGIIVFGVGAGVGALSTQIWSLIAARALMGLGASVFTPMSLALVPEMFDPSARSLATGVWSASGALGAPLGPMIGGLMIDAHGWRSMFWLDGVLALAVLATCLLFVPSRSTPSGDRRAMPWAQVVTSAIGFSLVTWGLINAEHSWTALSTWGPLCGGVLVIGIFVHMDLSRTDTLTDLRLLAVGRFRACSAQLMVVNLVLFGVLFVVPSYVETVLGNNAVRGGLMPMPLAIAAVAGSLLAAGALRHPRVQGWVLPGALVTVGLGLAVATRTTMSSGAAPMVCGLAVAGIGLGLAQSFGISTAMDAVPDDADGAGAALLSTVRQLGSVLGIALLGSIAGSAYTHGVGTLPPALSDTARHAIRDTVSSAHAVLARVPGGEAGAVLDQVDGAYIHAMNLVLTGCAAVSVVVALVAALGALRGRAVGSRP